MKLQGLLLVGEGSRLSCFDQLRASSGPALVSDLERLEKVTDYGNRLCIVSTAHKVE